MLWSMLSLRYKCYKDLLDRSLHVEVWSAERGLDLRYKLMNHQHTISCCFKARRLDEIMKDVNTSGEQKRCKDLDELWDTPTSTAGKMRKNKRK